MEVVVSFYLLFALARGELREAGHEGAQHQDEAQGCHLAVERVWWAELGQGMAAALATPKTLPPP